MQIFFSNETFFLNKSLEWWMCLKVNPNNGLHLMLLINKDLKAEKNKVVIW
jgi:hypothetical protein